MRLVKRLEAATRFGYLSLASQILLELDEWADSVGAQFLFVQHDLLRIELWLYGSYKAEWSWMAEDPRRDRSQHQAQQVSDDTGNSGE